MSNGNRTCSSRMVGKVAWSMALSIAVVRTHGAFGAPATQNVVTESPTTLAEIVVTAEKRPSTVQTTPMSLTAITGASLQAAGITSLEAAAQDVPGLSMTTSGPGQTEYEIRGISNSNAGSEVGGQPTTGFYLDDTPIAAAAFATAGFTEIDPDLFDLARIEVLRGPQGTLYGAGSEGGTIKLVTNKPDLNGFSGEIEGIGSGTMHGGLNGTANIMVNVPLVADKLAVRIVGTEKHLSGWIDRVVVPNFPLETGPSTNAFLGTVRGDLSNPVGAQVHKNVNDTNLQGVRAEVLIKPTEQLTIEPMVFYQKLTEGGFSAYDSNPGTLAHYQPFDVPEPFQDIFRLYSLRVNYDFPTFSLTSATAYQDHPSRVTEDASEQAQNALFLPAFDIAHGGVGAIPITEYNPTTQFSEELRLTSTTDGPLQWLIGGFYSNYHGELVDSSIFPSYVPIIGTDNLFSFFLRSHHKEVAVFGNVNYAVTHKLKATVGLRYSDITTTTGVTESGYTSLTGNNTAFSIDEPQTSPVVNPMANISYSPTDNLMFYATVARGFRAGTGQIPVPTGGTFGAECLSELQALGYSKAPTSVGPEHLWSYEAGEKAQLLDRTVTLNSDVFYENLADAQTGFSLPCGFQFTSNAAKARSVGTDIELKARLGSHVLFSQTVGYANAEYTANSPGVSKGEPLVNAPKWNLSTSIQYTTPVSGAMTFVARLRNGFTASHYDLAFQRIELPGYDLADARVGLFTKTWSGYLFVDNLTDKRAELTNRNDLFINMPTFNRVVTNQPRTIGIQLEHSF